MIKNAKSEIPFIIPIPRRFVFVERVDRVASESCANC